MARPVGFTPEGQPLMEDDAGNQFVVSGNQVTPYQQMQQQLSQSSPLNLRGTPAPAEVPMTPPRQDYAIPTTQPSEQKMLSQGSQETSKMQIQKGLQLSPEIEQLQKQGGMLQEKGLKNAFEAGQKRAIEGAGFAEENLRIQQEAEAQQLEREARIQTSIQDQQSKLEASVADLEGKEIDPNRFYANAGTNSRLLAGISIALGAVGQIYGGGGENIGLKIINDAITRDMEAQKMEMDRSKSVFNARSTLFGQNMEAFKDERAAAAATQLQMLSTVERKMQLVASKTANQDLLANYQMQLGKIKEMKAKKAIEFQKAIQNKVVIDIDRKPQSTKEVFDAISGIKNDIKGDKDLQDFFNAQEALTEMQSFVKAGASGAALISFIAKGMNQGSFGAEMEEIARNIGHVKRIESWVAERVGKGGDSPFIKGLMSGLQNKIAASQERNADKIALINNQARTLGVKPTAFIPKLKQSLSDVKDKQVE